MLRKISIPPGVHRESTQYAAAQQWYDANNIRFRRGYPEMMGGWSRDAEYILEGTGRAAFSSRDYGGNNYQFVGTDWKYYVIVGTVAYDITPYRVTGTTAVWTITSGDPNISVNDSGHGAAVNDWVVFTTAPAGLPIGGVTDALVTQVHGFQISEVTDDDNYKFYLKDWATNTVVVPSSGGTTSGTPTAYYKVRSGLSTQVEGMGWGAGLWGGSATPTAYALGTDPVAGDGATTTAVITNSSGTGPAVGGSVYLKGLDADAVDGVDVSLLNDNWWPVTAVTSGPAAFEITIPYAFTSGSATGGGTAASFYIADAAGVVTGATRGWGEAATTAASVSQIRRVNIDNYGEDIMLSNSGGPLYYWDASVSSSNGIPLGTEAATAKEMNATNFVGSSSPPTLVDSFLISKKDGHCVALGCDDITPGTPSMNTLLVRWSDQNNPFDWFPSPSNTSGGQVLRVGSRILGGVSAQEEVIIFTDDAVYSMRFIGPPDVFSFNLITQGVEIMSSRTAVNVANNVFFMGRDGFYVYTGSVSPLSSTVGNYVFDDLNYEQKDKCFAAVNSAFSEILWFYPSADSFEPDRFAMFNYEDNVWSMGSLDMSAVSEREGSSTSYSRTAWRDAVVFANPMSPYLLEYAQAGMSGASPDYQVPMQEQSAVMAQETGASAQGATLAAHIESGEVEISEGERFSFYSRILPDVQVFNTDTSATPVVTFALNGRNFPGEASSQESSSDVTFVVGSPNSASTYAPVGNATAVRGRARSLSMKVSSNGSNFQWRLGDTRVDVRPDGRR